MPQERINPIRQTFTSRCNYLQRRSDGIPDSLDTDDDNDGVNDSDEALLGTNPLVADTDGDGTSDGDADADNDGISNADESDASSVAQLTVTRRKR